MIHSNLEGVAANAPKAIDGDFITHMLM
jgi:hypothetical protein